MNWSGEKKAYFLKLHESKKDWRIREESWDPSLITTWESKFSLSNGLMGSRGIYEELPEGSSPGTFLSGFFDRTGSMVAELVNLPNPFQVSFSLKGEKLGIRRMDYLFHQRDLDLKNGLLIRHTLYRDTQGRRYDYQSVRLLSMADRRLGLIQVHLTALDGPADLTVEAALDTSVWNAGTVTEGKKRHWRVREISHKSNIEYVRITGLDEGASLGIGTSIFTSRGGKPTSTKDTHFQINLKRGKTLLLTKIFVINGPSHEKPEKIFQSVRHHLNASVKRGFSKILRAHLRAWDKLWKNADVSIKGDPKVQKALRFNLYHLLAAGPAPGSRMSIGAKALTGEGYRGHIFWDAEVFLLPFYTHVCPDIAEEMLLYRHDRIEAARKIAREKKYRGAMYPWESAGTGEEETPAWAKGLDGWITQIRTHKQEHHITADIAFSVDRYYKATADENFMLACGFEILFETARFWASRVQYNRRKKCYEINEVIGPDELHESVQNNAFTNYLAGVNLLAAHQSAHQMLDQFPETFFSLCRRINLEPSEINLWKEISSKIKINYCKDDVIEQFDGYFKKKEFPINHFDEYGLPKLPENFNWRNVDKTQLVKQADVLLLFQLFPDRFGSKLKKINFQFYDPRTIHQSSLSAATRALVASQVGSPRLAYQFFLAALRLDLENLKGNTPHGIHAANLGNVWQAIVFGFGGLHFTKDTLHIQPRLPQDWDQLSFTFFWKGVELKISIQEEKVRLYPRSRKKKLPGKFKVFGRPQRIRLNKINIIRKKK